MKACLLKLLKYEGDAFNYETRRITGEELDRKPDLSEDKESQNEDEDIQYEDEDKTFYRIKGKIPVNFYYGRFSPWDWYLCTGLSHNDPVTIALDIAGYNRDSPRWEDERIPENSIIHCEMLYEGSVHSYPPIIPKWDTFILSTNFLYIEGSDNKDKISGLLIKTLPYLTKGLIEQLNSKRKHVEDMTHIPVSHYIECQWNMAITGLTECIYYVSETEPDEPSYFTQTIPFQKEVFDWTYDRICYFRKRYVSPLLRKSGYPLAFPPV